MSGGIITFHRVVDIFSGTRDSWCDHHRPGLTLASYLPKRNSFYCYVRGIDGETIVDESFYVPKPGDSFLLREAPEEGGVVISIIVATILAVGSAVFSYLSAPNIPDADFGSPDGPSQSFGGIQTISTGGVPLPICYGEVRTGGNIVDSFESAVIDTDFLDEEVEVPFLERITGSISIIDTTRTMIIIKKNRLARSVSVLNTRVLLCAGPIEDITDIEINERSVEEFPGLKFWTLTGEQNQAGIAEFDRTVKTVTHVSPVLNATPVSITTTTEVDQIEIVLRFPTGIYRIDDDGFKFNRKVEILVEYRLDGASLWISAGQFVVDDFAINLINYRIRIAPLARAKYELRITRVTADETGTKNFSAFDLLFVNEIVSEDRNHPGVAQMAFLQLPGDEVSPIHPTNYTAVIKGFNDIRTYTSDTEFTTGWTDNPAWCCGHFLTSKQNGMGTVFDWNDINIPSFLLWAAHCDELVEDGNSALEKRATFNRIYDQRTSAKTILENFTIGTGVAIVYSGAKFAVIIDEPKPRTQIFSEANVLAGKIVRAYFPRSELPTRISVQFRNSDLNWDIDTTMQEDPDVALGLFQQSKTYRMLHITRPGQAAREAMRVVRANTLITQGIELTAGLQAASLRTGDRIGVSSVGIGVGLGSGQITQVAADDLTIHLDDEITFTSGTHVISVQHVNDGIIDTVDIVNPGVGVVTNIVVATEKPWRRKLQAGDKYVVGKANTEVRDYRIADLEMSGFGDKFSVKIRASLYDEKVFDLTPVSNPFVSANSLPNRDSIPGRVKGLKVTFSKAEPSSRVGRRPSRTIEVDWDPPDSFSISHYEILFREVIGISTTQDASWQIAGTTRGRRFQISDGIAGDSRYQIVVLAVSQGNLHITVDSAAIISVTTF